MGASARTSMCRNCATDFGYEAGGGVDRPLCPKCEEGFKWCPKCGYALAREGFHVDDKVRDGLYGVCRRCCAEKKHRLRFKRTPEQNRRNALRRYGLTGEDYDRMFAEQGGLCAICSVSLSLKIDRFAHVDHDHGTGKVRGILCAPCNKGLGHFGDDSDRLVAAALYLARAQEA